MVDVDPHPGSVEQRRQRDELIVDHLHVGDHVEGLEVTQQRAGIGVVPDAQQGGVERDAEDPRRLQRGELGARDVVAHDRHAPVAPFPYGERVEQAPVVLAVARVGADEHGMVDTVPVEERGQPGRRAELLPRGGVVGVGRVRKAGGFEHVDMTVDHPNRLHGGHVPYAVGLTCCSSSAFQLASSRMASASGLPGCGVKTVST
jgi:hypothetical protein